MGGDVPWSRGKFYSLIFGVSTPSYAGRNEDGSVNAERQSDGFMDVPGVSWYQQRCRAFDGGEPDDMLESIDFERRVMLIPDVQERAAVCLAMLGWDLWDVGVAIRSSRSGEQLVAAGVKSMLIGGAA